MTKDFSFGVFLLAAVFSADLAAETTNLGRLFMTPERRAQLDRQRQLNIGETQSDNMTGVAIGGAIATSSGKRVLWINGKAKTFPTELQGMTIQSSPRDLSTVVISGNGEPQTRLKVGEALDWSTRSTSDALHGGTVRVHRTR